METTVEFDPKQMGPMINPIEPYTMTILPTYKCTAACKECCFECNQHRTGRIPQENLLKYIEDACDAFSLLKLIVFSGGECFLLGDDLTEAIGVAGKRGKYVRCVSNGYWAPTLDAARRRLKPMVEAGLTELNLSTGDEHQEWVPFESVVNAAIAAKELGIGALLTIEGSNESTFRFEDAVNHPAIKAWNDTHDEADRVRLIKNVWIPFHEDVTYTQDKSIHRVAERIKKLEGCQNILHNMVINPREQLISCCGLTFEHISELHNGSLQENNIRDLYMKQYSDFMKIWIWVDGPEAILHFASQKNEEVIYTGQYVHPCQTCVTIHKDPIVRSTLLEHYQEKVNDVLFRYYVKKTLRMKEAEEAL